MAITATDLSQINAVDEWHVEDLDHANDSYIAMQHITVVAALEVSYGQCKADVRQHAPNFADKTGDTIQDILRRYTIR